MFISLRRSISGDVVGGKGVSSEEDNVPAVSPPKLFFFLFFTLKHPLDLIPCIGIAPYAVVVNISKQFHFCPNSLNHLGKIFFFMYYMT